MKRIIVGSIVLFASVISLQGQDEGKIVKRERIERDKSIFVGGGISILGGSNLGDYSNGINFEGGYSKRLNRVISIGGSLSYLSFKYDPSISTSKSIAGLKDYPGNFYYDPASYQVQGVVDIGALINIQGGDLSLLSLAFDLKVNFIPIKDNSPISVYGFAKPFISNARTASTVGNIDGVFYNYNTQNWQLSSSQKESYDSKSSITGGIFVGPGIEIFPTKAVSFFLQASFGYTFPLDVISTRSFGNDISKLPNEFPLKSIGFTSINFSGGISFNLD